MKIMNNPLTSLRSGGLVQQLYFAHLLLPAIISLTANAAPSSAMNIFENVSLSTMEIIANNGYTAEAHDVITEDGYILELHRIPKSKSGQSPTRNHPVFIHHGILGSSADWVLGGASMSLPMRLADDGYDVWMANCRGNTYSKKHVSLNCEQKEFWNFSLHEIGKYDIPAAIDYILTKTNVSQLHYIGYSMGTCVFFIMGSERPEYQPKIRSQISLAPVAFLSNTRSSIRYLAPYAKVLNIIFQKFSKGVLLPQSKIQALFATTVCRERLMQKLICEKCIIFSVCGSDPHYFDSNLIPQIMGHFPAGTSAKLAAHFAQFILKDTFGQYDYGSALNLKYYNSTEPPTYDLKSIDVPITLIYGENDILADKEDVMRLKDQLPKVMNTVPVNNPYCNHVDFLWSINVNQHVNNPIKEILQNTDDTEWKYSGPDPTMTNEIDDGGSVYKETEHRPNAVDNLNGGAPGLVYFAENLDMIIDRTMPRVVNDDDVEEFERERELQKMLFGNVINFVKLTEKRFDRFRDDLNDGVSADVSAGASARNAVETHVRKTSELVNDKITYVRKSVTYGIAKAEDSVVGGITKAENFVVGSVNKAEHYVVGGVVKAEKSVVDGIAKAENYVNCGVNKADRAVGNALNSTFRRLKKAFWFFK